MTPTTRTLRCHRLRRPAAIVCTVAFLAAGCGSGGEAGESGAGTIDTGTIDSAASPDARTGGASTPDELAAALTPGIEDVMAKQLVPGTVVLVRTPEAQWRQAFGTRVIGRQDPVTADDHFRIGSITKTVVGTVLLQLVQEGRVSLDDPVSRFRSDVPNGDHITIAQLLDMRSGLFDYTELESTLQAVDDDPTRVWQPEDLLRIGLAEPVYFPPGEGFHYSNTNLVLIGLIIEQITGNDLGTELSERVFAPLGLTNTSFPALDDGSIPDPHPHGYMFGSGVSLLASSRLPDDQIAAARAGTLKPNDYTDLNPSWAWAAGNAISTAEDLATLAEALIDGKLLHADLQQQRIDSLTPMDPSTPHGPEYGLALATIGPLLGHAGGMQGFTSVMGHDPNRGITIVVLSTLTVGPEGDVAAATGIAESIITALYGH